MLRAGRRERTDTIVLACTHYPLLLDRFERLAPWPVRWIDPAPAIARRVVDLVGPKTEGPASGEGLRDLHIGPQARPPNLLRHLTVSVLIRPSPHPPPRFDTLGVSS